jgi:hypothetical protein
MSLSDSASAAGSVDPIGTPKTAHAPTREDAGDRRTEAIPGALAEAEGTAAKRRHRLELLRALDLVRGAVESRKRGYIDDLREKLLKIHARLNEEGLIAPAFRPLIARQVFHGEPVGDLIFHDQMRIDLHWALHRGHTAESYTAQGALNAMKLHGIDAPSVNPYLRLCHRMKARVDDLDLNFRRQRECIWLCGKYVRKTRNGLLEKRDRNLRRLQEELRTTPMRCRKASLSRVDLRKICDVALSWQLGLLHDPELTMPEHARFYHAVSGDDEVTRHSIRHQREQVRLYIPLHPGGSPVRGGPTT